MQQQPLTQWLFAPPKEPISPWSIVKWWEFRRIPYNFIVGGCSLFSLLVMFVCERLQPGKGGGSYLLVFIAPLAANLCYTGGWLVEVPLRLCFRQMGGRQTVRLFRLGLGLSLAIAVLPAITNIVCSLLLWLRVISPNES